MQTHPEPCSSTPALFPATLFIVVCPPAWGGGGWGVVFREWRVRKRSRSDLGGWQMSRFKCCYLAVIPVQWGEDGGGGVHHVAGTSSSSSSSCIQLNCHASQPGSSHSTSNHSCPSTRLLIFHSNTSSSVLMYCPCRFHIFFFKTMCTQFLWCFNKNASLTRP